MSEGTIYLHLIKSGHCSKMPLTLSDRSHTHMTYMINNQTFDSQQYLELRFNRMVRICGTVTFIFQMVSFFASYFVTHDFVAFLSSGCLVKTRLISHIKVA